MEYWSRGGWGHLDCLGKKTRIYENKEKKAFCSSICAMWWDRCQTLLRSVCQRMVRMTMRKKGFPIWASHAGNWHKIDNDRQCVMMTSCIRILAAFPTIMTLAIYDGYSISHISEVFVTASLFPSPINVNNGSQKACQEKSLASGSIKETSQTIALYVNVTSKSCAVNI